MISREGTFFVFEQQQSITLRGDKYYKAAIQQGLSYQNLI